MARFEGGTGKKIPGQFRHYRGQPAAPTTASTMWEGRAGRQSGRTCLLHLGKNNSSVCRHLGDLGLEGKNKTCFLTVQILSDSWSLSLPRGLGLVVQEETDCWVGSLRQRRLLVLSSSTALKSAARLEGASPASAIPGGEFRPRGMWIRIEGVRSCV